MKRRLIILFAIISIAAQAQEASKFQAIRDAISKYDYPGAISAIDSVLLDSANLSNESFRSLTLQKARCQKKVLRYIPALESLSSISAIDDVEVMGEIADTYLSMGQYDTALGYYFMLNRANPTNIFFGIQAASLQYRAGDYQGSIELGKSLCKQEENAQIYSMVAGSYLSLKELDSAMVYYNRAYELNPSKATTINAISNIHLQRKEYEEVIELTKSYLDNYPDEDAIRLILGTAYYLTEQPDSAYTAFKRVYDNGDKSYGTSLYLGLTAAKVRRYDIAMDAYQSAWYQDSTDAKMVINMADAYSFIYHARKRLGIDFKYSPMELYDYATKLSMPDSATIFTASYNKGQIYMRDMDFKKALEPFKTAYTYKQDDYTAALIGICFRRLKDYKSAKKWYQAYLKNAKPGSRMYNEIIEEMKFVDGEIHMLSE